MSDSLKNETLEMVAVEALPSVNGDDSADEEQDNIDSSGRKIIRRGMGFCSAEDYLVCKSWILARQAIPTGSREIFMAKMLRIYETFPETKALPVRTSTSIFHRFRKVIAPCVVKMHNIAENTPQESKEDKTIYWNRLIKLFFSKERQHFSFRDCYVLLLVSPEFQQYNKTLRESKLSVKGLKDGSEASVAPVISSAKKAKVACSTSDSSSSKTIFPVESAPDASLTLNNSGNSPLISDITKVYTANDNFPERPFSYSARDNKVGTFSARGGSHAAPFRIHAAPRVIPLTGNMFYHELLRLFSDLIDVIQGCLSILVTDRLEDEESKKAYANALLKTEYLRIQEEILMAERRISAMNQPPSDAATKFKEDVDVEHRLGSQEQFWLGEKGEGSMKDRLEVLEMFVHNKAGDGGFFNRLQSLENQSRYPTGND